MLLAYGFRFAEGYGVRARVLDADASATSGGAELVLRSTTLPDGRVFVVFYHNRRTDVAAGEDAARAPRFIAGCVLSETG